MSYKLVCIYEFFDEISGAMINRGQEITDYDHMARLIAANREHQFNKVYMVMDEDQWEWPPVEGNSPAAKRAAEIEAAVAKAVAAEPETIAVKAPTEE